MITNSLHSNVQVKSAPPKAVAPKTEQPQAEQADQAELSGAKECAPVKASKSSRGFINGLKKTAAVAALAATLGCVATPAMADCYGTYGYNPRPAVAVQVDPYNGVTISQNKYNPYNGGSDHVAVTIGRNGVRLEAGHNNPWQAPPVVVMPQPLPGLPDLSPGSGHRGAGPAADAPPLPPPPPPAPGDADADAPSPPSRLEIIRIKLVNRLSDKLGPGFRVLFLLRAGHRISPRC
ncbi:MAG: hypothetical protein V9G12_12050 [Microthrixaceae bacterium]